MTNPDNVGGLLNAEFSKLMRRMHKHGDSDERYIWDEAIRISGELCRAAPAGGDRRAMYRTAVEKVLFPNGRKIEAEGEIYDERDVEPEIRHEFKDSAPAGSGEVERMAKRLDDAREIEEETSGLEDTIDAMRTAAALLRKLQQGAGNG